MPLLTLQSMPHAWPHMEVFIMRMKGYCNFELETEVSSFLFSFFIFFISVVNCGW